MTDQERQWIRDVINEKKVVKRPVEKPIEIPNGYLSYWESSAERYTKRLNRQDEFLSTRLKGLYEAISGYSKRGQTPPKELLNSHSAYAAACIEAQLSGAQYVLSNIDIASKEAANDA